MMRWTDTARHPLDQPPSTCRRSSSSHTHTHTTPQPNNGRNIEPTHSGTKWNSNTAHLPVSQPHHTTLHWQSPLEISAQPDSALIIAVATHTLQAAGSHRWLTCLSYHSIGMLIYRMDHCLSFLLWLRYRMFDLNLPPPNWGSLYLGIAHCKFHFSWLVLHSSSECSSACNHWICS
jgi:hypothetical protein